MLSGRSLTERAGRCVDEHRWEIMALVTFSIVTPKLIHAKVDGALLWKSFMQHFPSHIPTSMGYGVNAMTLFKPDNLDSVLKKWDRRTLYFVPRIARCDLMHCSPLRRTERVFRLDLE
jgi:hypothetical protein